MKKIVLASGSFWRKELVTWIGLDFEVVVSGFDEGSVDISEPDKLVAALALGKALTVQEQVGGERVVIGADTIAWHGGKVIGKPKDIDDARNILLGLRGQEHEIFTGIAVLVGEKRQVEVDRSVVKFREFSDRELEEYLETGESLGKAGAYMVLGGAGDFVEKVEGSVTGVVGLPLRRLKKMLENVGVKITVDVEAMLRKRIGYKD